MIDNSQYATILIVDDQPQNLHVLIHTLEAFDFSVMVAQSGEAALEQATAFPPDVILLDVMMPGGIDGFETCRRLKAQPATREIPVIFLTVLDDVLDKMQGFEIGGVDYLTKPLQHEEVLARIRTHLKIRRLQQALQLENARYRSLSEATFEGIVIHDGARIVEINQTTTSLCGYTSEELISQPLEMLAVPEAILDFRQYHTQLDPKPFEIDLMRKDHSRFPAVIHSRPIRWQDETLHVMAIRDITWRKELEQENSALKSTLRDRYKFGAIIGKSAVMQAMYAAIARAAATDVNVLLQGETGSGKELVAQTIHARSARRDHPFVVVNCGAISDALFEREFFGHRKGAFTSADRDTPGFLDAAHQGTLFLDEVGELTPTMQAALLRVLDHHAYTPVGSSLSKLADVRILAATHRNLPDLVSAGKLREDFFYRIHVLTITVPPLRERKDDLPLLIENFLEAHRREYGQARLPARIMEMFCQYDWPGNVRELFNQLHSYLTTRRVDLINLRSLASESEADDLAGTAGSLTDALERTEKAFILKVLRQAQWRKADAAQQLGWNRKTLYQKMKKYGLFVPNDSP
ncbi:MAG: sigma-54-dependent Fis family transcriptional regulator [Candidatus Vecturithrix sp.]|jgi:PAS domain S-box-containing protein|nr:sigma-54-dependent Fis family transcriptional regulator [Candidatus Vecturithrix sp.]